MDNTKIEKLLRDIHAQGVLTNDILTDMDERDNKKVKLIEQELTNGWTNETELRHKLNITKQSLQELIDNSIIPYTEIGNKCFFKEKDVKQIMESRYSYKKDKSYE